MWGAFRQRAWILGAAATAARAARTLGQPVVLAKLVKPRATFTAGVALAAAALAPTPNNTPGLADAVEKAMPSVVGVLVLSQRTNAFGLSKRTYSSGTGIVYSRDGHVLTNAHVVEDAQADPGATVQLLTSSGASVPAEVVGIDYFSDLALLRAAPAPDGSALEWTPATLAGGDAPLARPGEPVVAIGHPAGLTFTVTGGVVSSVNRPHSDVGQRDARLTFMQHDCQLHRGSSGGPLVNADGVVIGINVSRAELEGIGFAIATGSALGVVRELLRHGHVDRPWFGIRAATLTPEFWEQLALQRLYAPVRARAGVSGDSASQERFFSWLRAPQAVEATLNNELFDAVPHVPHGILVTSVLGGSPAARAGLLPGDVVVAVNGQPVRTTQELWQTVGFHVGPPVALSVARRSGDLGADGYALVAVSVLPTPLQSNVNG